MNRTDAARLPTARSHPETFLHTPRTAYAAEDPATR